MAVFKCKMCGGTLEINNNQTVAECEYCGTKQTLPRLDDERKANLYDRANHFRRNNEFDKAISIYEQILNEDNTDAEAYWSLVLCRYGIEYVEDPTTRKRIPTINRAQFTSIFDDEDYKSALNYADILQKTVYEQEAIAINKIQKGILAVSEKEEPFDVFICYKETDQNGRRTPDSVLATELYHELTREGYKVFFSRITLEDKLGSAYEPYIFAALNSSKVMVVLGTKSEYFNAVWVKNEWSRYLALIKNGARKMLIPAYKDMDPYDLPEEFSHLQAQDMSKLGFMQDLIRGIKKIVHIDAPKTTVVKEVTISRDKTTANIDALLERGFMALEDEEWRKANDFFEQVLNQNAKHSEAYIGKLMADLRVKTREELKNQEKPFDENSNYIKAMRFGDDNIKKALVGYNEHIFIRNENSKYEEIYLRALNIMQTSNTEYLFLNAMHLFKTITGYKDSDALAEECAKSAETLHKDIILCKAEASMKGSNIAIYEIAKRTLTTISGWKNADELIVKCDEIIEKLREQEKQQRLERERKLEQDKIAAEKTKKLYKKVAIISTPIICLIIVFIILLITVILPSSKYKKATKFMKAGEYTSAIRIFEELDDFKDSETKIEECEAGILDGEYDAAINLVNQGKYVEGYDALIALDGYKDSAAQAEAIYDKYKAEKLQNAKVLDIVYFGEYEQDNNRANGKEPIEWMVLEVKDGKALVISKHALDCKQYNEEYTYITWGNCTLRKWLNNDFINSAFNSSEKAQIPTVTLYNDKNYGYEDYREVWGSETEDRIFVLSLTEVEKYLSVYSYVDQENSEYVNDESDCKPTAYAIANGADTDAGWWLRSSGRSQYDAARHSYDGGIYLLDVEVNNRTYSVRPAMWIDLN